jgi:hypothetical protein
MREMEYHYAWYVEPTKPNCNVIYNHVSIDLNIGWSTHDCQISNFTEVDHEQGTRESTSTENGTTSEGQQPAVYETKFNQPGYFGLILVRAEFYHLILAKLDYLQDLTYGIVDPLPHKFTFTLEVISYICLVSSVACLTFLIITYLCTK